MKIKKEVQIGLLAIIALVICYVGINFLKGIEVFKKSTTYYAHFENLSSVTVATPVIASGFKVGTVRDVQFDYTRGYGATVELALDPHVRVTRNSQIKIKTNPLSGAELVLSLASTSGDLLSEGDTIASISPSGDLLSVASEQILPAVNNMMPTITSTLERLNALLHDKALDSMLLSLNTSAQHLRTMMEGLSRATGALSPTLANVQGMTSHLNTFTQQLTRVQLDSIVLSLQRTTDQLQQVSAQLRSRDNTAGLLLNDPSLYNRLDSLVGSADKLMRDLKENPKRYVHFSVF
nr:MlaD family protein [uncultured Porphyromonas sp.]